MQDCLGLPLGLIRRLERLLLRNTGYTLSERAEPGPPSLSFPHLLAGRPSIGAGNGRKNSTIDRKQKRKTIIYLVRGVGKGGYHVEPTVS